MLTTEKMLTADLLKLCSGIHGLSLTMELNVNTGITNIQRMFINIHIATWVTSALLASGNANKIK